MLPIYLPIMPAPMVADKVSLGYIKRKSLLILTNFEKYTQKKF